MDFGDSIKCDSVDQVWDSSNWRARQINAKDSKLWKLITRVAKAGIGMQNEIKESRSGGFAIVTSDDASEFFFGADDTFCFRYKVFVEDGVVSAHAPVRSFRIIMANPSC